MSSPDPTLTQEIEQIRLEMTVADDDADAAVEPRTLRRDGLHWVSGCLFVALMLFLLIPPLVLFYGKLLELIARLTA